MDYVVNLDNVSHSIYSVVGALKIKNNCCHNKSVIITKTLDRGIYSCQCECGGWCTTGTSSVEEAISEWKKMQ